MSEQEFLLLLQAFKSGQLDDASHQRFMQLVASGQYDSYLKEDLLHTLKTGTGQASGWTAAEQQAQLDRLLQQIQQAPVTNIHPPIIKWKRYAIAAAITGLLLAAGGALFLQGPPGHSGMAHHASRGHTYAQATLQLSNGVVVPLDSSAFAAIGRQGNVNIHTKNGELYYEQQGNDTLTATAMNTLSVPKGTHYQLTLADGSKVWLNSGSILEFPASFHGNKRQVRLLGEAYFDIAPDPGKPFQVQVNNMQVDVLGTRFNIMAYQDEQAIRTTLVDGAVRVSHQRNSLVLKPGEQAVLDQYSRLSVNNVNTDEETAWRNGIFFFRNEDISTAMRQLARWYDIDVQYEGTITKKFSGELYRNYSLEQTLAVLSATGLHFSLEGKKLIIKQ
ncbi:FecR family protein [Chitinophaga vietnamensis]|uniref:FecR family protein n=1 Tax=Chitinophaga vietnamensis TaxID=2593957 RepID=UPI001178910F|nr:FecR family protein [Chitinophaga vietnamensis]